MSDSKTKHSIRIGEKELESIIMVNSKALRESPPPTRGGIHNILYQFTPRNVEGWTIQLTSTHNRKQIIRWLVVKALLKNLNKGERIILQLLGGDEEFFFELILQILDLEKYDSLIKQLYLTWLEKKFPFLEDSERYFNSYTPKIFVTKMWTVKVRLPPILYIGVGYKDKGSLSSVPAWQEQMLDDGELVDPIVILKALFRSFLLEISDYYLQRNLPLPIGVLPQGEVSPADES